MTEQAKVPAIRFAGFTDPWEQRKLGDIASFSKGSGYSKADIRESGIPLFLYGRMYTQYETRVDSVDTFAAPRPGTLYSKGTEIVVPASGESAEDIARASAITREGIALGGDLNVVYPQRMVTPLFLAYGLSHGSSQKLLAQKAQGKTVVHIHASDLKGLGIAFPDVTEQQAIGTFFSSLDDLITLHQRKYDKLVVFKKSMLEKMFPKDGESVPEIRFAGFTDPWEQRKLGEVAPLQRGFDLPVNQMTPGPYPVVMSNGIGGWHSKYMVKGPGVVTGRSGTIGSLHYIEQNFWPHNTSLWVTSFNGNEPRFIYWLYASIGLERFGSGSGVPTLNRNDVHDLRVGFPCDVAEQRRIGTFFSRLDSLITLHQRKLELLQNIKKSLLDKMFA